MGTGLRWSKVIPLVLLVGALALVSYNMLTTSSLLYGFKYFRPILIHYQGSTPAKDSFAILSINTQQLVSEGKLASDCSDLRFELDNKGVEDPYVFITKCPSINTEVAVYVGNLVPEQTVELRMYYKYLEGKLQYPNYILKRGSFKDVSINYNGWRPNWNDVICNRYICYAWRDAGRDAFDTFGFPQISDGRHTITLDVRPGSRVYSLDGNRFWVRVDHPNPWIWRMVIIPIGENNKTFTVSLHGNLGSDWATHVKKHYITLYGDTYAYWVSNDEANVDYGTWSDPQIRYFIMPGDPADRDKVTFVAHRDNVRISANNVHLPVTVILAVGDLGLNRFEQYLKDTFTGAYLPNAVLDPASYTVVVGPEKIDPIYLATIEKPLDGQYIYTLNKTIEVKVKLTKLEPNYNKPVLVTLYLDNNLCKTETISNNTTIDTYCNYSYYGRHSISVYVDNELAATEYVYIYKDFEIPHPVAKVPEMVAIPGTIRIPITITYNGKNLGPSDISIEYYVYDTNNNLVLNGVPIYNNGYWIAKFNLDVTGNYIFVVKYTYNNETYTASTTLTVLPRDRQQEIISKIDNLTQQFENFYFDYQQFKNNTYQYLNQIINNTELIINKQNVTLDQLEQNYETIVEALNAIKTVQTTINESVITQLEDIKSLLENKIVSLIQQNIELTQQVLNKQNATYDELATVKEQLDEIQSFLNQYPDLLNKVNASILSAINESNEKIIQEIDQKSQEILNRIDQLQDYLTQAKEQLSTQINQSNAEVLNKLDYIQDQLNYTKEELEELKPINDNLLDIKTQLLDLYNTLVNQQLPALNQTVIEQAAEIKELIGNVSSNVTVLNQKVDNIITDLVTINQTINTMNSTIQDVDTKLEDLKTVKQLIEEVKGNTEDLKNMVSSNAKESDIDRLMKKLEMLEKKMNMMYENVTKVQTMLNNTVVKKLAQEQIAATNQTGTQSVFKLTPTKVAIYAGAGTLIMMAILFIAHFL